MLKKISSTILLISILFLLFGSLANAQTTTAELSGVVSDETGAILPKVQVTITNTATAATRTITTDEKGRYVVPQLPPGPYEVSAALTGFEGLRRTGITLAVGQEVALNLTMRVGEVNQQITISEEAPLVNTSSSSVSGVVEQKRIEELPLNGRDFTQLALVETGVLSARSTDSTTTKGFGTRLSMAGSRTDQTNWLLDGTNIKSMANLGTPGSAAGVMLGVDAIREFQVLTSNYTAEFGGTSGGVVNLISKTGTNQFHGTVYEYLRNGHLDARNFFDRDKAAFKRNQFGFSAGGPIRKDRLFIFGNFEALRERLGETLVPAVPDAAAHLGQIPSSTGIVTVPIAAATKPFLDLWPLPNGGEILNANGSLSGLGALFYATNQRTNENFFVTRSDYRLNDRQTIFARFTFDNSDQATPDALPISRSVPLTRTRYITLQHDAILTPMFLATSRVAYNRTLLGSDIQLNVSYPSNLFLFSKRIPPGINIPGAPQLGPDDRNLLHTAQNLYQFSENMIYTHGAQTMKFGFDMQKIGLNSDPGGREGGTITYASLSDFLQDRTLQTMTVGVPGSSAQRTWRQKVFAGYFQDDWKLRNTLTLNLGVRYEPFTTPTEKWGRLAVVKDWVHDTSISTGIPYWNNPSLKNFAPRVGFAWDVDGKNKTAVRGGFGMFYVDIIGTYYRAIGSRNPPFYALVQNPLGGNLASAPSDVAAVGPSIRTAALTPNSFFQTAQYNLDPSYEMKFNLTVERELPGNMSLSAGYIGARGIHLWRITTANAAPSTLIGDREYIASNTPRVNPKIGGGSINYSDAQSFYNALQVSLKKRLSKGFQVQTSYTWSKNIDDSTTGVLATDYLEGDSSRPYNLKADRGLSALNLTHNLVVNGLYSLPSPGSGITKAVVGGWQVSGIFTASTGVPFSPTVSGSNAPDLARTAGRQRPDRVAGRSSDSLVLGGPDRYFDTSAFFLPAPGFYGNAGRNIIPGPGLRDVDFSLAKNIPLHLTEGSRLEFRTDFFNLLNHANFKLPAAVVFNASNRLPVGTAGRITATSTPSRQMQFSLKLFF